MTENLPVEGLLPSGVVTVAYIGATILFILALGGLSNPETSRRGNLYGMAGMAIAIVTTLFIAAPENAWSWLLILGGLGIGGVIGAYIARQIPMTAMPQLVAAFHSLVGLAAVFVAAGALYAPEAFGIATASGIAGASLFEMALGTAIGAVTFTGSIIAFAKLDGRMSGASGKVLAAIQVTPEAANGGLICRIRDGDWVCIDAEAGTLQVEADLSTRATPDINMSAAHSGCGRELFAGFRNTVGNAANGASVLFQH